MTKLKKFLKKNKIKVLFFILISLIVAISSKPGQAFTESAFLTTALASGGKFSPIDYVTKKPVLKEIYFTSGSETIAADVYIPREREKTYPAAVVDLGIDIDRKDERVRKVAESFARSGIVVLSPNIPSLTSRRMDQNTVQYFIDSYKYLETVPQVDKSKMGFFGFCASGGISLLAAESDDLNQKVNFVVTVNPFFDLKSLYKTITTKQAGGETWIPHFKTVEMYNKETIALLEDTEDRKILQKYLVRIPPEQLSEGNYPQITDNESKTLTKEGKFTLDGLTNKDPEKSDFYLTGGTEKQKQYLESMSPSNNISKLNAKVFILLDKYNVYLPQSEGLALKQALPTDKYVFTQTYSTTPIGQTVSLEDKIREANSVISFLFKLFMFVEK